MKPLFKLFTFVAAVGCFTGAAFAADADADADPTGIWKWTVQGSRSGPGFDQVLKLEYKEGRLTGVMDGRSGQRFSVPDTAITEASFENGVVKFAVTREFNGRKFTTTYEGKLEGGSIKGTYDRPGINSGGSSKTEWNARRASL